MNHFSSECRSRSSKVMGRDIGAAALDIEQAVN
jgi:hypothetical protein